mmetsp:Transcript_57279/g.158579  ORF Transcript_57279/g.158579 Transcript_57279/m.158579 type:complete len:148 (-) Transcript_57279:109-552(-)
MEAVRCYLLARSARSGRTGFLFEALCWASTWKLWFEHRLMSYAAFLQHPVLWLEQLGDAQARNPRMGACVRDDPPPTQVQAAHERLDPALGSTPPRGTSRQAVSPQVGDSAPDSKASHSKAQEKLQEHINSLQNALELMHSVNHVTV